MTMKQKQLIKKVAVIFKTNHARILRRWMNLLRRHRITEHDTENRFFASGFKQLLQNFITYLSRGDFAGFFASTAIIAKNIAVNDVSYPKFVSAFHLFEESYNKVLLQNVNPADALVYLEALDRLNHAIISKVSEAYFEIKDSTVFALAKLAELRDPETAFHLERTREYSVVLSQFLGLDQEFVNDIYRVGPLHDIGKVGIPDHILLKPAKLTAEEFETMKKHPGIGGDTISQIIGNQEISRGYLKMAREIALCHHEKFNGSGYPEGLQGEGIPLAARIFALADAYDALVSRRPYKEPIEHDQVVKILQRDRGTHFDPVIFDAFMEIQDEFRRIKDKYQEP